MDSNARQKSGHKLAISFVNRFAGPDHLAPHQMSQTFNQAVEASSTVSAPFRLSQALGYRLRCSVSQGDWLDLSGHLRTPLVELWSHFLFGPTSSCPKNHSFGPTS